MKSRDKAMLGLVGLAFSLEVAHRLEPPHSLSAGTGVPGESAALRPQARVSLQRALSNIEANADSLSFNALFLLRLIDGARPGSRAGAILERGLRTASVDPAYSRFSVLLQAAWPPYPTRRLPGVPNLQANALDQPIDGVLTDRCLSTAIGCRITAECRRRAIEPDQGGYVLTHQLLFIIVAKKNACDADLDYDALIERLARSMMGEQTASSLVNDLYLERMALGSYVGYREFLRDDWIREVLHAQHADGCWQWGPERPLCNDHATGMAAWVLALYLGSTPD